MYIMYCRSLQKGGQSLQVDVYSHVQFTISEVSLFCLVFFPLAGSSSSFCVSLWPKHGQLAYVEQCYMNNIVWKQHCISWLVLQSEASQGQSRGCKVLYLGGGRGRVYIAANSWHWQRPSDTLLLMIAWRDDRKREKGVDDLVRIYIRLSELAGKNFIVKKSVGWDSGLYNQV